MAEVVMLIELEPVERRGVEPRLAECGVHLLVARNLERAEQILTAFDDVTAVALFAPPEAEGLERFAMLTRARKQDFKVIAGVHSEAHQQHLEAVFDTSIEAISAQPKSPDIVAAILRAIDKPSPKVWNFEILRPLSRHRLWNVFEVAGGADGTARVLTCFKEHRAFCGETAADKFIAEAKAASLLVHPGTGTLLQVGGQPDIPFTLVEVPQGRPLDRILSRAITPERKPPVAASVWLATELLAILRAAHARTPAMVHGGIEPSGVWVTALGGVHLLNVGTAGVLRELDRKNRMLWGSSGVAAALYPEELDESKVTAAADVFAVASLLYSLLCHRPAFDSPRGKARRMFNEMPPAPHTLDRRIPVALSDAIMRALSKDPAQRYPCAQTFRSALVQAMGGLSVLSSLRHAWLSYAAIKSKAAHTGQTAVRPEALEREAPSAVVTAIRAGT